MNKKLIAAAVVGAFAAPAVFAQSSVQIYGTINSEYGLVSAPTGDLKNYDGFDSGNSNLGFKGEEKLGGGMTAWFQCESDLRFLAGGAATGTRGANSGELCDRNSALGINAAFGSLFVGTWDSPHKLAVGKTRMLADTGFLGVTHMTFDLFSNRNAQSINYHSPDFSGFKVMAQTTSTNPANGETVDGFKGRRNSIAGTYDSGPLSIGLGLTKMNDNRSENGDPGDKDTAWSIGATYKFGPAKVGFTYYDENFKSPVTNADFDIDRNAYNLALHWDLGGPNSILAGYTVAGDVKGTVGGVAIPGNNGAKEYQISFIHSLSKRTTTAIGYARLKNDADGAFYTIGNNVAGKADGDQINGGKSSVITLQVNHKF